MFGQRDTEWKNELMGFGKSTIGSVGCYLTSLANGMLLKGYDYNPSTLNKFLKDNKLFLTSEPKNYIDVDNLHKVLPDIFNGFVRREPFADSLLKDYLDKGMVVLGKVDARPIGGVIGGTHFVLILEFDGKNPCKIFDPWTKTEELVTKKYSKYGNILGLRVFDIIPLTMTFQDYFKFDVTKKIPAEVFKGLNFNKTKFASSKALDQVYEYINELENIDIKAEYDKGYKAGYNKADTEIRNEVINDYNEKYIIAWKEIANVLGFEYSANSTLYDQIVEWKKLQDEKQSQVPVTIGDLLIKVFNKIKDLTL